MRWKAVAVVALLTVSLTAGAARARRTQPAGEPVTGDRRRCEGPLSDRLYQAALAAPGAAGSDGMLYGMQRWHAATRRSHLWMTFPGLLSCAYTVSAIFRGACHPIGKLASVKRVDAALSRWQKVTDARALKPGDIVFWKPTRGTVLGIACPGHWHVGVSLGSDATVDNDWWSGMPKKDTLERRCTVFAHARRSPA